MPIRPARHTGAVGVNFLMATDASQRGHASAVLTADGGVLLAADSRSAPSGNKTSPSFGFADFWMVKLDVNPRPWGTLQLALDFRVRRHQVVERGVVQVPEARRIFPEMTVVENLRMGSFVKATRPDRARNVERVFALFPRLKERQRQLGGTMSGGEQQMLAIARGLMGNPKLLLLDEPSLGLAPLLVKFIFEIITEINKQGVTILLVEQNVYQSLRIAHRAYVLETGRVVLSGTGEGLLNDEHVRKAFLGM